MITETSRLLIRELNIADAGFVLALVNERSFIENIGDKEVRNLADAKQFILKGPWTYQQPPGYGQFAVELKDSGIVAGVCGILYRKSLNLTDVGFAFLPEYWGQGLAFDSARAVINYAYSALGVDKIHAMTSEDNLASIGLLEKLGLRFETIITLSDDAADTALYSLPDQGQWAKCK